MKKGRRLHEGKTKKVWAVKGDSNLVIIRNKDAITKNDDPSQTEIMPGKGKLATTTTCAVFQLLKEVGIPVAFERRLSPTEFLSPKVEMIPLEIIWRRYAVGSFLKRSPNLAVPNGNPPHRFHQAVFELFLKTTNGVIKDFSGEVRGETPVEDPLIVDPNKSVWYLVYPKKPAWDESSKVKSPIILKDWILPKGISVKDIENLLRRVGLVLEGAWSQLGCRLIDFKIEMGVTPDGQLVVADVIDADSWRLRDAKWQELSKQLFRDNVSMDKIADKYALVAKLVEMLRISQQAIVFWRGSESDDFPKIPQIAGVDKVEVTLSGHKSPGQCLGKLEEILTEYPEGGVILACVGMSNGLGPTLAARTSWPVISVPMDGPLFSKAIWSSLQVPSKVPMNTILSPKNAVLAALNILAQKNPAAYAERQQAIEELDTNL